MMQKKMSKGMLMAVLICGSISVLNVASAEEMQTFEMDEFVVTASRVATSKVDTPANISVISAEDIADKNYSNVQEVLADTEGVNILGGGSKGSINGEDQIMINGDTRVLVLVDGRRMNVGSTGKTSANWLPPANAIERVEVLKGGGSALYGSDAVGGVINIITKKGAELGSQVTLKAVGGSWGTEQYGLTASGSNDKGLGVFISANKERRGNFDYKNQHGDVVEMKNSGYNTEGVNLKLDQTVGDDDRITFAFEHNNTEGGVPYDTMYGFLETDRFKRLNNNVSLRYDWNETAENSGYFQVYKNYQHARFLSVAGSAKNSDFTDETIGFTMQQNLRINDNNELTVGAEYYKTEVENKDYVNGKNSVNNKAIYLEERWKVSDTWQVNTGLRYDEHNRYGEELTPKVALNKKVNDDSNVYVSWGKVFKAPTVDQLYYRTGLPDMPAGNPDLNPEKGDVWTLGANTKIGEKTELAASFYYCDIDNAIVDNQDYRGDHKFINANKEKRRGMEISVNHKFDEHLSGCASYTYMEIKQDNGNGFNRNSNEKPNTYRAGLKYKNAGWTYNADVTAVSGQQVKVDGWKGYTDRNYFVLDLGVQYKVRDNLKLFANAYNVTNARYQEVGGIFSGAYYDTLGLDGQAWYPMPSRSFIIGAEYKF
ncbi:MAG: TonB-dependent receptor [Phascolarctobacterium sp.]|nr:TonB-dependent receptor [Phascolarctobacterium sp.]